MSTKKMRELAMFFTAMLTVQQLKNQAYKLNACRGEDENFLLDIICNELIMRLPVNEFIDFYNELVRATILEKI